jgi:formylglycine-generating enzyme required for sulfatase activity
MLNTVRSKVLRISEGVQEPTDVGGLTQAAFRLAAPVKVGGTFKDCDTCPTLVAVPGGRFMMGGSGRNEQPAHPVTIERPFAISKYEVTADEWAACVRERFCPSRSGLGRMPVTNVTWDDAKRYADWLTAKTRYAYRLPSEAEWEYAARAGSSGPLPFPAAQAAGYARCQDCDRRGRPRGAAPVGSLAANGFGLHDMLGNVWEWVEDCHHDSYKGAPTDGTAWQDPVCLTHTLRGGSYAQPLSQATSTVRWGPRSGTVYEYVGFRVVRALN